jgi:uncharacterized protein
MLVGVLVDTHDRLPAIDRALKLFKQREVQMVLHGGDLVAPFAAKRLLNWSGPLHVIYGNNDGERTGLKKVLPQIDDGPLKLKIEGRSVLMHHAFDWFSAEDIAAADIIIGGHTHEQVNEIRDGKLYLNPGECCGWVSGICSVAILDTAGPTAEIIEVNP